MTLELFHEIHFMGGTIGYNKKLVSHLSSLKGWHSQFIFMKGGDWKYMPQFRFDADVKHHAVKVEGPTRVSVIGVCNSFVVPLERDDFLENSKLYDLGRKWFFFAA